MPYGLKTMEKYIEMAAAGNLANGGYDLAVCNTAIGWGAAFYHDQLHVIALGIFITI